jgi:hypothetical protein
MYTREEIEADTSAFIKQGGAIKSIPIGVISDVWKKRSEVQSRLNAANAAKGRLGTHNQKQQFHLTNEGSTNGI